MACFGKSLNDRMGSANSLQTSLISSPQMAISLETRLRIIWYFSCPRTWLYALLGYHFGYYIGSEGDLGWKLWVGDLIYGALGTGATNFINHVHDQKEDSVNKPIRITYLKHVTEHDLMVMTWACYAICLALSFLYGNWLFVALCMLSVFHSHQYSAPPLRLKKSWTTNNLFLSFGSNTIPFIAGWIVSRPVSTIPLAPLILGFLFILFTLISKDVPDIEGDRYAKLSTIPLDFGMMNYQIQAYIPIICTFVMVLFGFLPIRFNIFGISTLVALSIIFLMDKGKLTPHGSRITHFVKVFTYSQMANCLLYSLIEPTYSNIIFSAITAVITFIFIFTAGFLYPSASSGIEAANPQHGG